MTAAPHVWEPANDVERVLRDACLRNDTVAFLRTLAALPAGFAQPAATQPAATQPAMTPRDAIRRLLTWQHDERTHLLVFTSPQALRQQLTGAVDGWRLTDMTELVGARPDPGYGIAINPNAPIGACLNADDLTALAGLVASAPVFHPADARRGYPWVGLPSGGIHAMGNVQDDARGVLVIENADTFQQVCMHCPEVTDRWLCVWGKGSATSGVVAFLELMSDVPIAVWGDLDAYGIQIVTNLAERLKRDITPVAMTADLYAGGTKYKPDDIDDSKRVAEKMVTDGLPALQGLAQVIADADGLGCEQETRYDEVLPALAGQLSAIEGSRRRK